MISRGWDWGPLLMTCGPWRAVRLESHGARISDIRIDYSLDADLNTVTGHVTISVEGPSIEEVRISIAHADDVVFEQTATVCSEGRAIADFRIDNPKLWYPHGYGDQPLYTCEATIKICGHDLHTASRKTGFRRGELVQQPDRIGKSFYFRINNVDIFCGGSDWIPADSFTPRISKERYRKWLQTLVDGFQVMIR